MDFLSAKTKDERRLVAEEWNQYMTTAFGGETESAKLNTYIFDKTTKFSNKKGSGDIPNIVFHDETTVEALKHCGGTVPCILNFASFTRPGGGFMSGSSAQEESLCHSSNLYNILVGYQAHYDRNYKFRKNNGLYENWAIYTHNVSFIKNAKTENEEVIKADVITCAAPNKNAFDEKVQENPGIAQEQYKYALKNRIKFLLDVCESQDATTLILGAFGCGVFGNNPRDVAEYFKYYLYSGEYSFKNVIFAIPRMDGKDTRNFNTFIEVFK